MQTTLKRTAEGSSIARKRRWCMFKMDTSQSQVHHRQNLFIITVKSCFFAKISKYQNLLGKHVHFNDDLDPVMESGGDEVELVLGLSQTSLKSEFGFRKFAQQLSSAKLFQWILKLLQKAKARRILAHLYDLPDAAIKSTILDAASEVAIAYEYQLSLLHGDEEIVLLAQHSVSCFMAYLDQVDAKFTVGDLLQALLEIIPNSSGKKELVRTNPVLWNGKYVCLKWKLCNILKQPGLRMSSKENLPQIHPTDNISPDHVIDAKAKLQNGGLADHLIHMKHSVGLDDVDNAKGKYPAKTNLIELRDVSSVILGQYVVKRKAKEAEGTTSQRRISTLDMDFEQGTLNIYDHTFEVDDDFSPVSSPIRNADLVESPEEDRITLASDQIGDSKSDENISEAKNCAAKFISTNKYNDHSTTDISKGDLQDIGSGQIIASNAYQTDKGAVDGNNVYFDNILDQVAKQNTCRTVDVKKDDLKGSRHLRSFPQPDTEGTLQHYKFYGCFTPYGAKCQPSIYGFRGPLHVWDDNEGKYTLVYNDRVTVNLADCKEINDSDCVHQKYQPLTFCQH